MSTAIPSGMTTGVPIASRSLDNIQQKEENTLWVLFCNLSFRPSTIQSRNWNFPSFVMSLLPTLFSQFTRLLHQSPAQTAILLWNRLPPKMYLFPLLRTSSVWHWIHSVLSSLTDLLSLPTLWSLQAWKPRLVQSHLSQLQYKKDTEFFIHSVNSYYAATVLQHSGHGSFLHMAHSWVAWRKEFAMSSHL